MRADGPVVSASPCIALHRLAAQGLAAHNATRRRQAKPSHMACQRSKVLSNTESHLFGQSAKLEPCVVTTSKSPRVVQTCMQKGQCSRTVQPFYDLHAPSNNALVPSTTHGQLRAVVCGMEMVQAPKEGRCNSLHGTLWVDDGAACDRLERNGQRKVRKRNKLMSPGKSTMYEEGLYMKTRMESNQLRAVAVGLEWKLPLTSNDALNEGLYGLDPAGCLFSEARY